MTSTLPSHMSVIARCHGITFSGSYVELSSRVRAAVMVGCRHHKNSETEVRGKLTGKRTQMRPASGTIIIVIVVVAVVLCFGGGDLGGTPGQRRGAALLEELEEGDGRAQLDRRQ